MLTELHLDDCLNAIKLIDNNSVDMILTDIPYGINYKSNRQSYNGRTGNDISTGRDEYFSKIRNDDKIPTSWLSDVFRILKNNSAMYIFIHWSKWGELKLAVESSGFNVKNMIVMNKSNHGMGDLKGDYAPKHELVMYTVKGRHILNRNDGRKKNVMNVPVKFSGSKRYHPNEKPVSWMIPFIKESSDIGDVVLDPFMGSGTVGIACVDTKRKFIGIELDKEYFKIARKRIDAYQE